MEGELHKYAVGKLDTIFYVPEFISQAEHDYLLHQVNSAPLSKWKTLKNRRLQNWGGVVASKGLVPQPLPAWLTTFTERICKQTGLFPSSLNHVLVNEYLPGQGIMPHQDGPSYFPVVAILSLGAPALMKFKPHLRFKDEKEMPETSVALMPRSLLIFKDSAYEEYLHSIDEAVEHELDDKVANSHLLDDKASLKRTEPRISLTCRYVPKQCRNLLRL